MTTYQQRVVWTALPRGRYPDGSLHVVAFVSPQLSTDTGEDTTLDPFDFARWPSVPIDWGVSIEVNGVVYPNADHPATVEPVAAPQPLPAAPVDLWQALFPTTPNPAGRTTLVRSFTPAPAWMGTANVASAPVGDLVDYIRGLYQSVLSGPNGTATEFPAVQDLLTLLAPASFYGEDGAKRYAEIRDEVLAPLYGGNPPRRFIPPDTGASGAGQISNAFVQHQELLKGFVPVEKEPQALERPTRDFHEYVSHLGHYRHLVRLLGLAVDLKVTFDSGFQLGATNPLFPPGPSRVRLVPRWAPSVPATTNVRPVTVAVLTGDRFQARPRPDAPLLVDGLVPLSDQARYRAVEIDHDGAAIKLRMLAENLQRAMPAKVYTPMREALPSLRSGGISVAMVGDPADPSKGPLAGEVVHQIDRGLVLSQLMAKTTTEGLDVELYAEDVTRGLRFDVWDDLTHSWHSLSAREGTFTFTDTSGAKLRVPTSDEAIHALAPTAAPGGKPSDLHQQQTLFHWTGWSLGVHRPGAALLPHYKADDDTFGSQDLTPGADFQLGFDPPAEADSRLVGFQAPKGSLPRLRFGATYFVRARAADLAGGSANGADPGARPGTPEFAASRPAGPVFYGRFEPVQAPVLVFVSDRTEGESIEHLVLRSNFVPDDDDARELPVAPAETLVCERHVIPPKVSIQLVEQHGKLDVDAFPLVDPGGYSSLARRDAAQLPSEPEHLPGDQAKRGGVPVRVPSLTIVDKPDPAQPGQFAYLPDPLCRGAAFVGLPGHSEVFDAPFIDGLHDWPDPGPFRLTLLPREEGPANPSPRFFTDVGDRRLEVYLDRAEVCEVRMSSHVLLDFGPDNADLAQLALWHPLSTDQRKALLPAAADGRVWMFTPFRTLKLVHAVRQPLETPEFAKNFRASRDRGQTFVTLRGDIGFSAKSTGRVDLHASWPNPIDDAVRPHRPTQPGDFLHLPQAPGDPVGEASSAVPYARATLALPLDTDGSDAATLHVDRRHQLHDTKHKTITYVGEATTCFAEYFTHRTRQTTSGRPLVVEGYGRASAFHVSDQPLVPGSVTVKSRADDGKVKVWTGPGELLGWSMDAAAGDLWFNAGRDAPGGRAPPLGTIIEVAFVAAPISRSSEASCQIDVLASARPAAPDIDRLVPTFGWTTSTGSVPGFPINVTTSSRDGSVLRVYLRRPWWTSGEGERLGVVLFPGGVDGTAQDVPDALVPYVTQWGVDPIVNRLALPTPLPTFEAFPDRVGLASGLALDELRHFGAQAGTLVDVAVHEVAFDADQDLWYCDVRLATDGAYQPFVRLALARYQADALAPPLHSDDLRLSRVVLADILQLSPGRTATVRWSPGTAEVNVTLSGTTYLNTAAGIGPGTAVVLVERRRQGVSDPVLGWEQVASETLDPDPVVKPFDLDVSWSKTFTLPDLAAPGRFRLVIEQRDTYHSGGVTPTTAPRVVHDDIINLG